MSTRAQRYANQPVLVVGLGVSGVSALRYLTAQGARVTVTDSRAAPKGIDPLRAQYPQVQFHLGAFHAPQPLDQFRFAVLSPGVSPEEAFVQTLIEAGVEVIGDIELFARQITNHPSQITPKVVGITGSNGKSTVTTLVGEMAKAAGLRVAVGGNLGTPALDLLADDVQLYVLELSSFQLETTHSLHCAAATVLNLSQDHLDRHHTMENYGAIKARIYRHCDVAVVNRDDEASRSLPLYGARMVTFGLDSAGDEAGEYGLCGVDDQIWLEDAESPILNSDDLKIFGLHNIANALAALALADAVGIARAASVQTLENFTGLPHRCEFVRELDGVRYFNDSKGTNVGSTRAALNGLPAPIVWLAGGQGKGQSFAALRAPLAEKGRAALLFGEDAPQIAADIAGALPVEQVPTMFAALARARALAQPGDQVLLSPACASFDQFKSYVDRGQQFRAAVEGLA